MSALERCPYTVDLELGRTDAEVAPFDERIQLSIFGAPPRECGGNFESAAETFVVVDEEDVEVWSGPLSDLLEANDDEREEIEAFARSGAPSITVGGGAGPMFTIRKEETAE